MTTLIEYFDRRAREIITLLDQQLQRVPVRDADSVHRMIRELRGTAQMAREDRVTRAMAAFEPVVRGLAQDASHWSDEIAQKASETAADLRALVERSASDEELEARVEAIVERWSDAAHVAAYPSLTEQPAHQFLEFAAREVAAIADVLEAGVQQLAAAPMDRQPLRSILHRQRALLGAARLDEVPVVAEILRAVEDLTRVIVKLDIGVKEEWLAVYRVARDGLRTSMAELAEGVEPQPSNALRRLRHLREELLERYGAGEVVSAAADSAGLVQATSVNVPPEHAEQELLLDEPYEDPTDGAADVDGAGDVAAAEIELPIDDLVYSGDAALQRALALRELIDRATAHDPVASDAVDELFDLIRLARN